MCSSEFTRIIATRADPLPSSPLSAHSESAPPTRGVLPAIGAGAPGRDSQRRIARALRELTDEAGYPPSIREIGDAVALPASTVAYQMAGPGAPRDRHPPPHRSRSYQVRR